MLASRKTFRLHISGEAEVTIEDDKLLTLCGRLTNQKTHRGGLGLGLGGSVHEEAHP